MQVRIAIRRDMKNKFKKSCRDTTRRVPVLEGVDDAQKNPVGLTDDTAVFLLCKFQAQEYDADFGFAE